MALLMAASIFLLFFLGSVWWVIHIPRDMPRNIPTIPIYVSLLGLWSDMGQDEIYERWLRRPMEKYGAVKIWFAGRWSVLVTKPEYLTDMFRNEDLYAKAGSQVKIPWSVIASLVGDNVINTHVNWKKFTAIMKPGLQKRSWDSQLILEDTRHFVSLLLEDQKLLGTERGVLVNPLIQRWAVQCMGKSFLDIDIGCLDKPGVRLEELQSIIKRTLFKPLFFNFPVLDKYPHIIKSRQVAFNIMKEFGDLLFCTARARPSKKYAERKPLEEKQVVDLLDEALDNGEITKTQYYANIKITFLTAHENAQQLLNSAFWELGKRQDIQSKMREEILSTEVDNPTAETFQKMPYLTSVLYELLRLYPPVSQLINRVTTNRAVLGGDIVIPKQVWVGWNAYGVQVNPKYWPEPLKFKPERWGTSVEGMQTKFRKDCVSGKYIPFNAHARKCLGQGFALLEMKLVLFELIRRTKWSVDPTYKLKLTSGGILAPLGCRVILEELDHNKEKYGEIPIEKENGVPVEKQNGSVIASRDVVPADEI